jgi:hypothetical protein
VCVLEGRWVICTFKGTDACTTCILPEFNDMTFPRLCLVISPSTLPRCSLSMLTSKRMKGSKTTGDARLPTCVIPCIIDARNTVGVRSDSASIFEDTSKTNRTKQNTTSHFFLLLPHSLLQLCMISSNSTHISITGNPTGNPRCHAVSAPSWRARFIAFHASLRSDNFLCISSEKK